MQAYDKTRNDPPPQIRRLSQNLRPRLLPLVSMPRLNCLEPAVLLPQKLPCLRI